MQISRQRDVSQVIELRRQTSLTAAVSSHIAHPFTHSLAHSLVQLMRAMSGRGERQKTRVRMQSILSQHLVRGRLQNCEKQQRRVRKANLLLQFWRFGSSAASNP
jgi:hypothetical protein